MRFRLRGVLRLRRGGVAALFAALLPISMGLLSLSIDTAMLATARAQLSTAADAAALAGAIKLADEYRVRGATDLTPEINAANAQAATFAQANPVLNQTPVINQNLTNDPNGDIVTGYLPLDSPKAPLVTSSASATLFNSVQVTMSRSATHGGPVPTFFGQLMGYSGSTVTVQSTATAQNYTVKGFQSVNNLNANLLPIVLDKPTWQSMMAGTTTDQFAYNPTTNTVTNGPDGVYESVLYPVSANLPGNWGTIKVGVSNNSTSTLAAQIQYGITPGQLATFPNGVIQLDNTQNPPSIQFGGNPGISAGISSALTSIIGKPVVVPIYDNSGGNGNNAWYRVIAFQPSRVLSVNFKGNPKYVVIQPCLLQDPTVLPGTALTSWTQGGVVEVHLSK